MKLKYFLTFSIAILLVAGCSREASVNQPPATAVTQPAASSTESQSFSKSDVVKSGTFVSGEHSTQGTVRILNKDGKTYLELDRSFKTSNMGPDLVVILHRSDNVLGSTKPPSYPINQSDYVIISRLQKFTGAQIYPIPENVNLADYKSAGIWCRKFNATFGVATLK
jgi:Electron transfer DM13